MTSEPRLEHRSEQPCVAIRAQVTMAQIAHTCPPLIGEVFAWLGAHGAAPAGPVFFRYVIVEMDGQLEIDVGVPVSGRLPHGDERVRADVLPGGRYATLRHTGPYTGLREATGQLLEWGSRQGPQWQASPDQQHWAARIEWYPTDPMEEPDERKWVAEIAMLVRGT